MKLKNYDYILFSNIVITSILQLFYFNVIGLISVVLSALYLIITLFSNNRSKLLVLVFVLSIIFGMMYYVLNPLYQKSNISMASLLPIFFLTFEIFHAITMPIIKRNSISGVKTPLALKNDEVWKEVNNVGSIICYITLFPLYIVIIYFNDNSKLALSILIIILFAIITLAIAFRIEKKYKEKIQLQENIELQIQRKKETGG